jgi:hypothetical protein
MNTRVCVYQGYIFMAKELDLSRIVVELLSEFD